MIELATHIFRACKNDVGKSKLKVNRLNTHSMQKAWDLGDEAVFSQSPFPKLSESTNPFSYIGFTSNSKAFSQESLSTFSN